MEHGRVGIGLIVVLAVAIAVSAGCVSTNTSRTPAPGKLAVTASWRDTHHLDVVVENIGGSSIPLGGSDTIRLTGPAGVMPVLWNGMAPTLAPGESRTFDMHVLRLEDGSLGVTMDHATPGTHAAMPAGDYVLRIGDTTTNVPLT